MANDISSLAKAFADVTYDNSVKEPEDLFYGVINSISDRIYVRVDGSDAIIPVQSSVLVGVGDRVMVRTKDHQAVIEANDTYKSGSVKYELDQTIIDRLNMLQAGVISAAIINASEFINGSISGSAIDTSTFTDGTISGSKIINSTITGGKIANATITASNIVDGTITNAKIANATISYAKIDSSFVGNLIADSAFVTELQAEIASFGYITAQQADLDYAQIDFANVANGAINTALIHDGAITDAKIATMSANKLTAGTIDASNITVTNLNATNITTGSISVDGITIDVTNNEASIDGGYIENGTITMNGLSSDVVAIIDGAIETFTCNDIPTLQNYPVNTWTASDYDKHVGDVAYVVNPSSTADGYTYRFTKSSNNQYSWVLIKDTDITKALQDILDIQGDISAIESFDSTVSSFMTNTDSEITSLKGRTSSLETTMGTKVDTSTFNTLSQTVDTNSSNITTLTTTTDSLGTRMTQAETDITQNATNITTKVSKTDFTGQNVMSMINQDASSVTISASKVNLNGAVTFSTFDSSLQNQITGISNTATSAQTTANTANTTANSAYAHTRMLDTRNDNQPPSWYTAKTSGIYNEFKLCSTIGISTTATYCYLTTYVPWQGLSGGLPVQEATFSESDAVYRRYGTSASEWSAWKSTSKILAGWQYSDTTYIDGGNIYTGTITAGKITVQDLSTISDNIGTITAGVLQSHNYVADTSGMKLTLSDGVWDSKDFKISSTGAITSTAGTIGGWTIDEDRIVCGDDDEYIILDAYNTAIQSHVSSTSNPYDVDSHVSMSGGSMHVSTRYSEISNPNSGREDWCSVNDSYVELVNAKFRIEDHVVHNYDEKRIKISVSKYDLFFGIKMSTGSADTSYTDTYYEATGITSDNSNFAITLPNASISSAGLITAKGGIDSWGKVEGATLKINDTTASSFAIAGGGSIAGALAVGGSITSNNKNVVVDNYASGFMGFITAAPNFKSVPNGTSVLTNLTYVDLTPGVYAVECTVEWDSNSTTGYRHLCLSTSSIGGAVDRFASVTGPAGPSYDRQSFVRLFHITSNTRFYLNVQQTSGGPINTLGGIQALRLGNN